MSVRISQFFVGFFSNFQVDKQSLMIKVHVILWTNPTNSSLNIKLFERFQDLGFILQGAERKEEKSESPLLGNAFYCSALLCFLHLVCKKVGFYSLAPLLCCLLFSISNCWDISCKSWDFYHQQRASWDCWETAFFARITKQCSSRL